MSDFSVMGVLNVTPDSFSDGGKFSNFEKAEKHVALMIKQGADIIDIGGESTRPGSESIEVDVELKRVIPVIQTIHQSYPDQLISIDTSKPKVMENAVERGASIINDVNALQAAGALEVAASSNSTVCLMHKQGEPKHMQSNPEYLDVVQSVLDFFSQRVDACLDAGISEKNIILDPGIGFGKTLSHNIALLQHIDTLKQMGFPILIGASRKTMIGQIIDKPIDQRLYGSLAVVQFAYFRGADIFRVHDVSATHDVLTMSSRLMQQQ